MSLDFFWSRLLLGFWILHFLSTLLCVTTCGFLLGFDVCKANVAMEAIVALTWMMSFTIGVIVVTVAHVCTILTTVELFDLQASDAWPVMVNFEKIAKNRVPTRTGKPVKMGRHFPVGEKSGNFEQTGKVREKSGKITQNTGKLR